MNTFNSSIRERLAFNLRAFIKCRPTLYRATLTIRGIDKAYFVNRDTDILIAGFGGSANTYATSALLHGSPAINLAHHLHMSAQVSQVAKLHTPCLVLICHPMGSISSLTTRNATELTMDGLAWAVKEYADYYEAIIKHRKS